MSLPSNFAQELLDMTIDHLGDDRKTLLSCSLVSRSWATPSRRLLFRDLHVPLNIGSPTPSSAVHRLHNTLTLSPHLSRYVKCLRVVLRGVSRGDSQTTHILAHILPMLRQLTSLALVTPDQTHGCRFNVCEELLVALGDVISSPLMTRVSLGRLEFINFSQFLLVMGRLPRTLVSLDLEAVSIWDPSDYTEGEVTEGAPLRIDTLKICYGTRGILVPWVTRLGRPVHIKTLSIEHTGDPEVQDLLDASSSTIQDLVILNHNALTVAVENYNASLRSLTNMRTIKLYFYDSTLPVWLLRNMGPQNVIETIHISVRVIDDFITWAHRLKLDEFLASPEKFPSLQMLKLLIINPNWHEARLSDRFPSFASVFKSLVARNVLVIRNQRSNVEYDSAQIQEMASRKLEMFRRGLF